MLRIAITPLSSGLHEVSLEPTPEDLDLDGRTFHDIHVDVRLDVQRDRVFAEFRTRALATLICDRTLKPFEQEVTGAYQVLFAPPSIAEADEDEWEDVRPLLPNDTHIDLTLPVRDTLMLSLPARRVAPGAEEDEIPLHFGALGEDDVDPRWEALRKLRDAG